MRVRTWHYRNLGKLGIRDPEPKKHGPNKQTPILPDPDVIAEALANINLTDTRWVNRDQTKPANKWSGKPGETE